MSSLSKQHWSQRETLFHCTIRAVLLRMSIVYFFVQQHGVPGGEIPAGGGQFCRPAGCAQRNTSWQLWQGRYFPIGLTMGSRRTQERDWFMILFYQYVYFWFLDNTKSGRFEEVQGDVRKIYSEFKRISSLICVGWLRTYWEVLYAPETHVKRQATQHDCLSRLLGDGDT
jgi:hypothetical protein